MSILAILKAHFWHHIFAEIIGNILTMLSSNVSTRFSFYDIHIYSLELFFRLLPIRSYRRYHQRMSPLRPHRPPVLRLHSVAATLFFVDYHFTFGPELCRALSHIFRRHYSWFQAFNTRMARSGYSDGCFTLNLSPDSFSEILASEFHITLLSLIAVTLRYISSDAFTDWYVFHASFSDDQSAYCSFDAGELLLFFLD